MSDEAHPPHPTPAATELPPTLPDVESNNTDFHPDERIGNYRLIRVIGGGMDLVWEAEQDQPRRIVALKLLRTGPGLPARVEPDVLARLNHPNIAQVYEAGTARVGARAIPFFAMEYIAGARTITQYADQQKLTRRQRIELFIQVCEALHHGHQRGFLHRDLKPENILVDSAGRVKVIDFGIAQAVGLESGVGAGVKRRSLAVQPLIGTPQYMSPEQLRLPPDELDRRTDVYALGLVLYELLCGKPPYQVRGTTVGEITRTICDLPPALPSRIDRGLRGDLEAILLAALAKSRDQRYASAGDLAAEQRRVLDYEPILRRSGSLRYRFGMHVRRFVARHRISTAAIAALLAFVVGAPLLFIIAYRLTPLNTRYERFLTSQTVARGGPYEFDDVRIVTITEQTDLAAIAQAESVQLDPKDRTTWRPIHGRLQQRLRNSGARVVAFDIVFAGDSPDDDDEFVKGTQALEQAGIPVVVGMGEWQVDAQGMPNISSRIASATRFDAVGGRFHGDGAWMVPLVYVQRGEAPVPSFSLVASAAARHPNADIEPHVDPADLMLDLYYTRTDPETKRRATAAPADRIPFTAYETEPADQSEFAIVTGARAPMFLLPYPLDATFDTATIDYGRIFSASDVQIQEWFAGKTIVIGNVRADAGDFISYPGGGKLAGVYAQAAAIQMLLRPLPIRVTSVWFDVVAAVLGAVVGTILAARPWARWTVLIALGVVACVFSVVAYEKFQYMRNPVVGIVVMWIAAEMAGWAGRARRRAMLLQ